MIASATPSRAKLLSSPSPALKLSAPASPTRPSLPAPARSMSFPVPPNRESLPSAPSMRSMPPLPKSPSLPAGPGLHAGGARGATPTICVDKVVAHEDVVAVAADERAEVGMDDVLLGPAGPPAGRGQAPVGERCRDPVRPAIDDVDPLLLDGGVGESVRRRPRRRPRRCRARRRSCRCPGCRGSPSGRRPRCCGRRPSCRSRRLRRCYPRSPPTMVSSPPRPKIVSLPAGVSTTPLPVPDRGGARGSCRPHRCRSGSRRCWSRSGSGGRRG